MSDDQRAARLAAIAERAAAATPGPWRWRGNLSTKAIELRSLPRPIYIVMDFVRWGFQSATPRFLDSEHVMRPPVLLPSAPHNAWDIVGIDHPDAIFIEHSRKDIDFLLGEVARLRSLAHDLADKENGARTEQMRALHAAGIIATDESLHAHIERADAFTARQHDRINLGEEDE